MVLLKGMSDKHLINSYYKTLELMKKFDFYYKWLLFDCYMVIFVGLFIAFMKATPLFIFDKLMNPYFWEAGKSIDTGTLEFQKFTYSLLGACMSVWGILMLFIMKNSFIKRERWARNSLLFSLLVWFPIDEFFSIYYGVYFNAIFNIPFLLMLLIPLLLTRKEFELAK